MVDQNFCNYGTCSHTTWKSSSWICVNFLSCKRNTISCSLNKRYNLHKIVYNVPGFICKVTTHPDLVCVCGLKEILEEMNLALLLKDGIGQILSCNTTFQLDFYASSLIFRHSELVVFLNC